MAMLGVSLASGTFPCQLGPQPLPIPAAPITTTEDRPTGIIARKRVAAIGTHGAYYKLLFRYKSDRPIRVWNTQASNTFLTLLSPITMASSSPVAENVLPVAIADPAPTVQEEPTAGPDEEAFGGLQFWLVFSSMMIVLFLSALDFTVVSTALPTIINRLGGTQFIWVGSAFALTETAFLPFAGGLAQIFGRRPTTLGSIFIFALGSALCGAAKSMGMLIGGRAVQGMGAGGIFALTEIVIGDLVPLKKRGPFVGIISAVWALAASIGPPVGGALAEKAWRWIFFLNLPLCGIAAIFVMLFMHVKTPPGDIRTKIRKIDFIGNFLVITGITLICVAITWAGVTYAWSSFRVLVPLILGCALLGVFFYWEFNYAVNPVVPKVIVGNRTSLAGYATTFFQAICIANLVYFLPTYFQSVKLKSPVGSGVDVFPNALTITPGGIACGISVAKAHKYVPQHIVGWILATVGIALLTLLKVDSSTGMWVGFQVIEGFGIGILAAAPRFSILSPLPVEMSAPALTFFIFSRYFAQAWGLTIGSSVLQNQLKKRLPSQFLARYPGQGVALAYSVIPDIHKLEEPLQSQVRKAFADSLRVIWIVVAALAGVGLLTTKFMKEIPMHVVTDKDWGLKEQEKGDADDDMAQRQA